MMKKKGQGLSLNMVVVGAISIVVVVVIIIFLMTNVQKQGQMREDASGSSSCKNDEGGMIRKSATTCYALDGQVLPGKFSDVNGTQVCCTK